MFFNVLSYERSPMLVPIPSMVGKMATQGSLILAFALVLTVNRKGLLRPNLFLALFSLLAVESTMMSVRFVGLGTDVRAIRLLAFLAVLWLLTPWWGRPDMPLLRAHLLVLTAAVTSVVIGFAMAPHKAMASQHRLGGDIWPMPPPQVAHYAGEAAGLTLLLWMCGLLGRRRALIVVPMGFIVLVLTHTRTALIATLVGLLIAGMSLLTSRRRVRRAFAAVLVVVALAGPVASPFVTSWLARGQSKADVTNLSGRTKAWGLVVSNPRPESNKIFGSGLSNESINGLSIDNSWLAVYNDQGIVGDVLVAAMFLVLIIGAGCAPRGPGRAVALFLVVYCLIASFAESAVGDASTYTLDLIVAASVLVMSVAGNTGPRVAGWSRANW
jgi:hypothetical protein